MDTDSAPEVKESRVARAEREAELSAILARNIARHGAIQANADAYPEPSERARNPMVYDVMREAANWLQGEYLARERATQDADEKQRWREAQYRVDDEVRAVDPQDQDLVRAKTDEFTRLRERKKPESTKLSSDPFDTVVRPKRGRPSCQPWPHLASALSVTHSGARSAPVASN